MEAIEFLKRMKKACKKYYPHCYSKCNVHELCKIFGDLIPRKFHLDSADKHIKQLEKE